MTAAATTSPRATPPIMATTIAIVITIEQTSAGSGCWAKDDVRPILDGLSLVHIANIIVAIERATTRHTRFTVNKLL